jgi:hypothetical protein
MLDRAVRKIPAPEHHYSLCCAIEADKLLDPHRLAQGRPEKDEAGKVIDEVL